ncbi:MAG: hypothetical protein V3W41_03655 [Planctomycetota bacterium]
MKPSPALFYIRTVDESEAQGPLQAIYAASLKRAGKVFNIVKIMSLRPRQITASMSLYENLMHGDSELTRTEREMLATVVSRINECFY